MIFDAVDVNLVQLFANQKHDEYISLSISLFHVSDHTKYW